MNIFNRFHPGFRPVEPEHGADPRDGGRAAGGEGQPDGAQGLLGPLEEGRLRRRPRTGFFCSSRYHQLTSFQKSSARSFLLFTLAISKCYGKVRVLFFPRDNSLISRGNSHVSRVRGLVVRCLLFNPEVSCSNPWVCANFFTSIPKQKVLTFFGTMRLFGFVRLFSAL